MTTPETPQSPENIPVLTYIPELSRIEVTYAGEEPGEPFTRQMDPRSPDPNNQLFEEFASFYLQIGEGVFTLHQAAKKANVDVTRMRYASAELRHALGLPHDLYECSLLQDRISFGRFTVAMRQATQAEKDARAAEKGARVAAAQEERELALQAAIAEVEAAEATKINLIETDHASITVNDRRFYIPLLSDSALLGVRTIQAMAKTYEQGNDRIAARLLAQNIWDSMPLAERRLFTTKERELYGKGKVIDKQMRQLVGQLANPMGITLPGGSKTVYLIPDLTVEVDIKTEPPETPYSPKEVMHAFPPGTEKGEIHIYTVEEAATGELAQIKTTIDRILGGDDLDHEKAIGMLDILMDSRSKILARRVLVERYGLTSATSLMESLDTKIQRVLDYVSYDEARKARTIGGGTAAFGKGVQQVSGRLPGRTFRHLGEAGRPNLTSRWTFIGPGQDR